MVDFGGRIVFLGCGSVAQCALAMFNQFIHVSPKKVTIIDYVDNRDKVAAILKQGASYHIEKVTQDNYTQVFNKYLSPGDFLIDLAWNVGTAAFIDWCHAHGVRYLNTAVEVWDPYANALTRHPSELTLYYRQMELRRMVARWETPTGPTAIVDHGANPGLVSHFTKRALNEIAAEILKRAMDKERQIALEKAMAEKDFARIAQLIGLKTIHISERDTQITDKPKQVNEFVNTWSVEGFIEEGVAPAELGWGTHEKFLPKGAFMHGSGPCNQIGLAQKGIKTWVQSWVPSGPITGMVIRHGEAFSISDALTVWEDKKLVYRPTIHYAYCPCDAAVNSIHELEMRHFDPQPERRILCDEIIDGWDELGCLMMGHDLGAWWIGSVLDIHTARRLVPGQNATTLQVAAGVLAAAVYAIKHDNLGLCLPEDLDHDEILALAMPYLGNFISKPVEWSPLDHAKELADFGARERVFHDPWQFPAFVVTPVEFEEIGLGSLFRDRVSVRRDPLEAAAGDEEISLAMAEEFDVVEGALQPAKHYSKK